MITKATREGYGDGLCALAEIRPDLLVLDADLAAATKTSIFKKAYPEKHYDCGIAEANMMGVAAGIATTGKLVFASSFAMFAAGRAFEIVRNSIAYPNLNVKIGATHAYFRRRGRRYAPMQRGYRAYAFAPEHDYRKSVRLC